MYLSAEMYAMLAVFTVRGYLDRDEVLTLDQRRLRALWIRGYVDIDPRSGLTVVTEEGKQARYSWEHADYHRQNSAAPLFDLQSARHHRKNKPTSSAVDISIAHRRRKAKKPLPAA